MAPGRCRTMTASVRKLAQFEPEETYPFGESLVSPTLTTASTRSFPVSEPESPGASQLDVELLRQIDAICRRFEADWRAGARPPFDPYLAEVPDQARPRSGPSWKPWSASCDSRRRRSDERKWTRPPWRRPRHWSSRPGARSQARLARSSTKARPSHRTASPCSIALPQTKGNSRSHLPPESATSVTTKSSAKSPAAAWASCSRRDR